MSGETNSGTDGVECQYCGALAPAGRTMCPGCRRRMRPPGQGEAFLPPALQEMLAGVAAPASTRPGPGTLRSFGETGWSAPPSQFRSDFQSAFRTLGRAPWLVVVAAALSAIPAGLPTTTHHRTAGWAVLLLPLFLFEIGFSGTQRVWLLRTWRQTPLSPRDCWTLSWRFFGPLFRLGLLMYWPVAVLLIPTGIVAAEYHATWLVVVVAAASLLLDTLLTFVVPELIFGPPSAVDAWRSGRHLLRVSWPECRWYVVTPGLCLLVVGNSLERVGTQPWLSAIAAGVASVVALIMKSVILSYYIRLRPGMASISY